MPEGSRRLFVGIELDSAARSACAAVGDLLRKTGLAAKFESPDKLHVTLAFLGNVAAQRAREVESAVTASAALRTFDLTLDKLGAFPHERKPRVIYVGSRDQGEAFRDLSAALRTSLSALGFAFDDDAVAHVTIARVKKPLRPLPLVEFSPIPLRVASVSLFESLSDKSRNTSRYEVIAAAPLGKPLSS